MGAHGGEQIAETLVAVVMEYDFAERLGVYTGGNADSNDTAWKVTLSVLHTDRGPKASRSRCLGHIINLAAKALFSAKTLTLLKLRWTHSPFRFPGLSDDEDSAEGVAQSWRAWKKTQHRCVH